jgi:integrase/recombinase XerD
MSRRRSQPKRGGKQVFAMGADPTDPTGFHVMAADWVEWLATHNFSHATLVQHSFYLSKFVGWAELRGIARPADVTFPILEAYQRHASLRRKSDGTPLAWSTQSKFLGAVRVFFSWCAKQHRILYNPASELVMPRQNHKLPTATLTHDEAEVILAIPDTATPLGLRDRTVMEILYATAMRRGEVVGLDLGDVDLPRRWLTLRNTKNRWDRVVPMGERAAAWLTRYLTEARPHLLFGDDPAGTRCDCPCHLPEASAPQKSTPTHEGDDTLLFVSFYCKASFQDNCPRWRQPSNRCACPCHEPDQRPDRAT